jgi:hypothetical protein
MSYCANCGVELEKSEKICPLCGLEVCNPRQPWDEKAIRPYPRQPDPLNDQINRRFTAAIMSISLAFPAVLCVVINLILDGKATWGLIAAGALALIWLFTVPYYLYRKPNLTLVFLPIVAGAPAFMLLIAWVFQSFAWYLPLALPILLITCLLVYLAGILVERRLARGFSIPSLILATAGFLVLGIEIIVKLYLFHKFQVSWSLLAAVPCLAVALALLAVARRQSIREEIKKRIHL